jgi:hypothetical protein
MSVLQHTLDALKVFDEGRAARAAAWENLRTNADTDAAFKADQDALEMLRQAFYADTKGLNSLDHCRMVDERYIRYAATGHPGDGTVNIGAVYFGRLTGETWENGDPKWQDTHYMGNKRVALLTDVYEGKPLPKGLILVGDFGARAPIKASAVHWASSGIPKRARK